MEKKYINGIQQVISLNSWKIIAASKGYCKTIKQEDKLPPFTVVKEVISSDITGTPLKDLSDRDIFIVLSEALNEILDENKVKKIILEDIEKLIFNNSVITYDVFCKLLIRNLTHLKVRQPFNDKYIDLYLIEDENKQLLSIDEANDIWLNKEKTLY